jgi:hypothetical protein
VESNKKAFDVIADKFPGRSDDETRPLQDLGRTEAAQIDELTAERQTTVSFIAGLEAILEKLGCKPRSIPLYRYVLSGETQEGRDLTIYMKAFH